MCADAWNADYRFGSCKKLSVRAKQAPAESVSLLLVSLKHVLPERLNLLHVTALAIHGHTSQEEALREFAFQADFLYERASCLTAVVVTQPERVWQTITRL